MRQRLKYYGPMRLYRKHDYRLPSDNVPWQFERYKTGAKKGKSKNVPKGYHKRIYVWIEPYTGRKYAKGYSAFIDKKAMDNGWMQASSTVIEFKQPKPEHINPVARDLKKKKAKKK